MRQEHAWSLNIYNRNRLASSLKVIEALQDYLSFAIKFSDNKIKAWLGQPYLIESFWKKFGEFWSYKTPGTSNFLLEGLQMIVRTFLSGIINCLVVNEELFWDVLFMLLYKKMKNSKLFLQFYNNWNRSNPCIFIN